jgi:hypothetical protein
VGGGVRLAESETELTTAATNVMLGALSLALAFWLWTTPTSAVLKRTLWVSVLGFMSGGAWLGAAVHGLTLPARVRSLMWRPLYLMLGLAAALLVVVAIADWRGAGTARAAVPWALAAGVLLLAATERWRGRFLVFVLCEAGAASAALLVYVSLAAGGRTPGAATIAAGLAVTLAAAVVQASGLRLRLGVEFDHNGLFHLVQAVGTCLLAAGARFSLRAAGA